MGKRNLIISLFFVTLFFGCNAKNDRASVSEMRELLKNHTLVVAYNDGTIKTYNDNGIKPLFKHLEHSNFKNSRVFDRFTGKASSLILIYGGATELDTGVLSREAIPILEKYNVKYSANEIVDYISNKTYDDKCPIEKAVSDIDNPENAYKVLKAIAL